MKARILIDLDLDADVVAHEGARHGYPLDVALEAVLSDLEDRLCDAIKFRHGVTDIRSQVQPSKVETYRHTRCN